MKGADLAYPEAAREADEDSQVLETEVFLRIPDQRPVTLCRQEGQRPPWRIGVVQQPLRLGLQVVGHHHLEHRHKPPDAFEAHPIGKLPEDELLDLPLPYLCRFPLPESRQYMLSKDDRVNGV